MIYDIQNVRDDFPILSRGLRKMNMQMFIEVSIFYQTPLQMHLNYQEEKFKNF